MRPFVVKKIVDESGRVVEETEPQIVRRVISIQTAKTVTRMLEGVAGSHGTAKGAAIAGYQVAGKTGTSQKVDPATKRYSKSKYVATFVGFVPSDRPRLLISVSIDEPKGMTYGGLVAGPVFREVGSWVLNHLGVNPEPDLLTVTAETGLEKSLKDLRDDVEKRPEVPEVRELAEQLLEGFLPDFKGMGMRDVLKKGRSLGLKVSLEGSGLAVAQNPEPGSPIETLDTVTVSFNPPGPS
jgi:cell division protein FtsI (penicillin-binding protein 3)